MSITLRFFGVMAAAACLALTACSSGDAPPPRPGARAKPKPDDPKLTQSWKMAAKHSPMSDGDLGSRPEAMAQALYALGMPSVTHRVSKQCAESGALAGTASVALRFSVGEDGKITAAAADPAGTAGTCIADTFIKEAAGLDAVPAGDALLRLKFHPARSGKGPN